MEKGNHAWIVASRASQAQQKVVQNIWSGKPHLEIQMGDFRAPKVEETHFPPACSCRYLSSLSSVSRLIAYRNAGQLPELAESLVDQMRQAIDRFELNKVMTLNVVQLRSVSRICFTYLWRSSVSCTTIILSEFSQVEVALVNVLSYLPFSSLSQRYSPNRSLLSFHPISHSTHYT